MLVSPVKMLNSKILPSITKSKHLIKQAAVGITMFTSAVIPASCYWDYAPPQKNHTYINTDNVKVSDDIILPDTVNQAIIQDINDIHEKINAVFKSLNIIEEGKDIQDIQTLEFTDADGNMYKYTDIQKTDKGYEFKGTVKHNGLEENIVLKFSDSSKLIERPLVCVETSFNKKHHLSMVYQSRWRLGKDGKPERRLFQNRTNKHVEIIDPKEYYPYDHNNIFAIRKTENGISSKNISGKSQFTPDDEINNIKVIYK